MTFLQPTYLWGLLGLFLPILIHLWSRKQVQTIKIGSIQHLLETTSKKSSTIYLEERWLLVLRLLLLTVLVGVLAQPRFETTSQQEEISYVFDPVLLQSVAQRERFQSLDPALKRLLLPGLPIWDEEEMSISDALVPDYWQYTDALAQLASDSVVVFSSGRLRGIKGKRPQGLSHIRWLSIDPEMEVSKLIWARQVKDSIKTWQVNSNGQMLAFAKANTAITAANTKTEADRLLLKTKDENQESWIRVQPDSLVEINIVYAKENRAQQRLMQAAFESIATYTQRRIHTNAILDTTALELPLDSRLVWLSPRALPELSNSRLVWRPDPLASSIITPGQTSKEYLITKPLSPNTIVGSSFMTQLVQWLDLEQELLDRSDIYDYRTMAASQLQTGHNATNKVATASRHESLDVYLWLLLFGLLLLERIISTLRKQ
ncbi:MAG: BatA domain-containing protein [Dokdonia sp.]|jgi:hypothetical protein